jgi:hypothetical protein
VRGGEKRDEEAPADGTSRRVVAKAEQRHGGGAARWQGTARWVHASGTCKVARGTFTQTVPATPPPPPHPPSRQARSACCATCAR